MIVLFQRFPFQFPLKLCSYWRLGKINHVLFYLFHFVLHRYFLFQFLVLSTIWVVCRRIRFCRNKMCLPKSRWLIVFVSFFSFSHCSIVRPLVQCIQRHPSHSFWIPHHQIQHYYPINQCLQSIIIPQSKAHKTIPKIIPITIPSIISKAILHNRRNQISSICHHLFTPPIKFTIVKIIINHLPLIIRNNKTYHHMHMLYNRSKEVSLRLDSALEDRVHHAVKAMLM